VIHRQDKCACLPAQLIKPVSPVSTHETN
jgi:hypothetical protein